MIVVDASAMVEALIGRDVDDCLLDALQGDIHAPHLLDVEVLSVLRGLVLGGKLSPEAAEDARADYVSFAITRYDTLPLAERVWEQRHRYTCYDATYLALAEALAAPLFTCDAKLSGPAHAADVILLPRRP